MPRVGDRELTVLWNQMSMSYAYNRILDAYRKTNVGMIILMHDDLELTDAAAELKFLEATAWPDVAVVGVAGGSDITGLAWWNGKTRGYQYTDSGPLDFGERVGDVQSVEGSVMAFSRWAIDHLRFDERFTGFHGYDHIGMRALQFGKRVVVTDVITHHHTTVGFDSDESSTAWLKADALFRERYL